MSNPLACLLIVVSILHINNIPKQFLLGEITVVHNMKGHANLLSILGWDGCCRYTLNRMKVSHWDGRWTHRLPFLRVLDGVCNEDEKWPARSCSDIVTIHRFLTVKVISSQAGCCVFLVQFQYADQYVITHVPTCIRTSPSIRDMDTLYPLYFWG